MKHLVARLDQDFRQAADSAIASAKGAYMRHQFTFIGLQKPLRSEIQKIAFSLHPPRSEKELIEGLETLWKQEHREFHYAACDFAYQFRRLWSPSILIAFENMIRCHSWWDTVDLIASKLVGTLLSSHPILIPEMDKWIKDDYLWIRRSALLHQLNWKQKTDTKRLFGYCSMLQHEQDFFIRKAIGWVLRQYSKTNPQAVQQFVRQTQLSPLSIREASKYLPTT
jgi:3-methyladenine DNA glycosylase AlkD